MARSFAGKTVVRAGGVACAVPLAEEYFDGIPARRCPAQCRRKYRGLPAASRIGHACAGTDRGSERLEDQSQLRDGTAAAFRPSSGAVRHDGKPACRGRACRRRNGYPLPRDADGAGDLRSRGVLERVLFHGPQGHAGTLPETRLAGRPASGDASPWAHEKESRALIQKIGLAFRYPVACRGIKDEAYSSMICVSNGNVLRRGTRSSTSPAFIRSLRL